MEEISLEYEGQQYLGVVERLSSPDGPVVERFSFDSGHSWHETRSRAFIAARDAEKLVRVGADTTEAGEFEAFFLSLLKEVQGLEPGESLRVLRDASTFMILKERMVTAVSASTVRDVTLNMREEDARG